VSKKPVPPPSKYLGIVPDRGILELDRFTSANLYAWERASQDLNELTGVLFYHLEPERQRLRAELLASLDRPYFPLYEKNWGRIVAYRYSNSPLSSAGSLRDIGGRFNVGTELDGGTIKGWPALYLAENYETAYREKFGLKRDQVVNGLTPDELALQPGSSHSFVQVDIKLNKVFDLTSSASLSALEKILQKFKVPARAKELHKKLRFPRNQPILFRTAAHLFHHVCMFNWRVIPTQFGFPSTSQILAELIFAAGYEAILYKSSKSGARCLAVFSENLLDDSFVELADAPPQAVVHPRLISDTVEALSGWDTIAPQLRSNRK
jgi:RES domain